MPAAPAQPPATKSSKATSKDAGAKGAAQKAQPQQPAAVAPASAAAAKPQQPQGLGAASLGALYSTCVQLVNENKVSTKNAFDLKLIDHMGDVVDSFMGGSKSKPKAPRESAASEGKFGKPKPRESTSQEAEDENRFQEASCAIEASARIYACRVDCVHTDTYRILGGLNSAEPDDEDGNDGEGGGAKKKRRIIGVNTLERNEKNIVQTAIEADEQSDPMFRRMAALFDAGGAKGLLLSHLPIAEDLSLVFNGDVSLARASQMAKPMFGEKKKLAVEEIGLGFDTASAASRVASSKLCPEVDSFRRMLYGNVSMDVALPGKMEKLLATVTVMDSQGLSAMPNVDPIGDMGDVGMPDDDGFAGGGDDGFTSADAGPDMMPLQDIQDAPFSGASFSGASGAGFPNPSAPLLDMEQPVEGTLVKSSEDAIAFDELFEKFCGGGAASSQFVFFDEPWSRMPKAPAVETTEPQQMIDGSVAAGRKEDGTLVAALDGGKKGVKRPLFDMSGIGQPARPIETEPAHKHQLSEKAAQWQLHKDVPPYMIDRITMPSWPSWSKCDFACLGLRPHLMLKLVKKPQPPGDGPHSFSDLFSTVVVENPEAFPWLAMDGKMGGDGDEFARPADMGGDDGDEDFDGNGLPAHLDVDPQDLLFLRPDDKVVPGIDEDDMLPADGDGFDMPGLDSNGMDMDLVEQPATCGATDIGYSRNSKFVDVKLVKKHLWESVSEDISAITQKDPDATINSSFQDLVTRVVHKMPKSERENLSIQVCFICALHLCNEKGLEFKTDKNNLLGDFAVVGGAKSSSACK